MLRNTLRLALACEEDEELIHLAEIYGIGCKRLVGLLRVSIGDADRMAVYLQEQIEKAIRLAGEGWKIVQERE